MPVTPVTPTNPPDPTSLSPGDYTSTIILNRIFMLILGMVRTLQNATASQADRLTFLSEWQNAYTQLAAQVPTFTAGNTFIPGLSTTNQSSLNSLNANYTSTLQNRQSVVSDNAKSMQSTVNQSNDAVNQQSTLGTSILQQLSSLLSTIFK